MICVEVVTSGFETTLRPIDLAPNEVCQFTKLAEISEVTPQNLLEPMHVLAFVGAASAAYGLVFVINSVLYTMGYKR